MRLDRAREALLAHFGVATLEPFGCEGLPLAVRAAGAIVAYLGETQKAALGHLTGLTTYSPHAYMTLDPQTVRNLELFQGGRWGGNAPSLLSVLDLTRTPMGGRLLRRWLGQPLLELAPLVRRQDAVAYFHASAVRRGQAVAALSQMADLERVLNRIRMGTALPRDLVALKRSLEATPALLALLNEDGGALSWLTAGLQSCGDVAELIGQAIEPEPGAEVGAGDVVRRGFSPELDQVRDASKNAREFIAGLERTERERTGIKSLKVGYNKVFGYYIEVSNAHQSEVPQSYQRRQTLVGAERFITPELKEYESLILNARERIEELERAIYRQVCQQIAARGEAIASLADALAHVDVFVALAEVAARYGYTRPQLNDGDTIDIRGGRHPVVEQVLPPGSFVPNDIRLSYREEQLVILTGPNMSGKSTYIRQVALLNEGGGALSWLTAGLQSCGDVAELIGQAIEPEPGAEVGTGDVVRRGFSPELDQVRDASKNAREFIAGLERTERERTGIKSLKVGYNKVFGYYIEVSNAHRNEAPQSYQRRQTLVGAERFITPELKEYESLILNARERIEELERAIYRQVCQQIAARGEAIAALADALAHVDVFVALAEVAARYGYTRPHLNDGDTIDIRGGRHPVVEQVLPPGSFVPNDIRLSNREEQLVILTGPNMSGKSTYIRQVALLMLMAQVGSFIPADSATIGLVDRIFTRVGLQDDLATGQSTFMVEMVETATILHQATARSLVILDEIGRGTSTYDGLSIARAVAEYLHNHPRLGCKTLFATHYHELTELTKLLPRARNLSVAVVEEEGRVVFLHRIVPGGADKSYGVHVAQLAGLPRSVTSRAWEVLRQLESDGRGARPR
ncbi:MAG: DNA mismatch repair protein MutS, partial [Chloroflexota bacterium]|nr:DNA mismatch repair protein MutS [Chloroflexota bacterium]